MAGSVTFPRFAGVYIAKIRFIIKIIGRVMRGTNLRSVSYY